MRRESHRLRIVPLRPAGQVGRRRNERKERTVFIMMLQARSTFAMAALVTILVAAAVPGMFESDRANDAWSERLTKQAEHLQDEARAARAANAWSQRLNGLAAISFLGLAEFEQGAVGMSDRAIAAWTDRLTGLAEHYAAQHYRNNGSGRG